MLISLKRITSVITCALLTLALCGAQVPSASATILGTDQVGTSVVSDRTLTITEAPTINCDCGILVAQDGTVLWARSANQEHAMASITKMMTAVVALESGIDLNTKFKISAKAASVGESSAEIKAGESITLYMLLCGLLVHSGNDTAIAIAEGVAGSEEDFVKMMNDKVAELGLKHTHFDNPHGLDSDTHYSSASDLSVIARYAMQNETFRSIVGKKKVTIKHGTTSKTFRSTNSLMNSWDLCNGIKTGYTNNAGYCLAASAKKDGLELYSIVLGCEDEAERFTESYKLLAWGFNHYRKISLATAGETLVDVPMSGFVNQTVKAGVAKDVSGMVLDYDGDVSIDINLIDIPDGVSEGDTVGSITWRQGDNVITSAPLVALESKLRPLPFVSIWTSLCRLVGSVTGDEAIAESKVYVDVIEVERHDDLSGEKIVENMEETIQKNVQESQ